MALITLKEYAERCGRSLVTVRQKMYRGGLKTVRKIGRQYFIDENEPYIDERVISGKYVGFHEGYAEWKEIQAQRNQEPSPEAEQEARERETKARKIERLAKRKALLDTVRELGITVDEAINLIKR